ncbi:MAG: FapA family protein [Candidatus Neomarinimicrobiota bacterium]
MSDVVEDTGQGTAGLEPIEVQILDDGFVAALFVPKDAPAFPSLKQVHLAIERAGVQNGVDDQAVEQLIREQIVGEPVIFARGKPVAKGGDAKLIWHEQSEDGAAPRDITEAIASNNHEVNLFASVEEGQQILSKLPATEGESGVNVFGEETGVAGEDIAIPAGEGTRLSKDGLTLLAEKAGVAAWSGDVISVRGVRRVEGSVEPQSGPIKDEGSVYIEKDVRSGCRVEAMGDIYVGGNVENAEVYSHSGDVVVRNGVLGQGGARILAGGNIVAGFIQDATVGAKQDVEAVRYIMNSAVTAGRHITATAGEGIVRGGTLYAEKRIEVRVAGADNRIETTLKVGYTPPENLFQARYDLRSEKRRIRMELAYVQKRRDFLKLLKNRKAGLSDEKEAELAELEEQASLLERQRNEQRASEKGLDQRADDLAADPGEAETVRILETIYPEVSVEIGDAAYQNDRERSNMIFFRAGDRLSFGPLQQTLAKKD